MDDPFNTWRTVTEIAADLRVDELLVRNALASLELTNSRAHSRGEPRCYSPAAIDLVRRETRGLTVVTARSTVRTRDSSGQPCVDVLIATGVRRVWDGVPIIDCSLGGITEITQQELFDRAVAIPMTAADREEQRRDFAFANTHMSNPDITWEMIDTAADRVPAPKPQPYLVPDDPT